MARFQKLSLVLGAALFSCSMELPETVAVKTSAPYVMRFGSFSQSIDDFISVDIIKDQVGADDFSVYKYRPNGETYRQYLIKFSVFDKTFDAGEALSSIDMDLGGAQANDLSREIAIPDMSRTEEISIDIKKMSEDIQGEIEIDDIDLPLCDLGPAPVKFPPQSHVEGAGDFNGIVRVNKSDDSASFSSIKYKSGILKITLGLDKSRSASTTIKAMSVKCDLRDGEEVVSSSGETTISGDGSGTLEIDIAGKTLKQDGMNFLFSGEMTGTEPSADIIYYLISTEFEDCEIEYVTGLTYSAADAKQDISRTISLGDISPVKSATIGEGSVDIDCAMPQGWSGVSATIENFSLSGAVSAGQDSLRDKSGSFLIGKTLSLAGKEISTAAGTDIECGGEISFAFDNATVNLSSNVAPSVSCNVGLLSSVTVDTGRIDLSAASETDVPSEISSFAKRIEYSRAGLRVGSYSSDLPEGNDMALRVTSAFLDMGAQSPATGSLPAAARERAVEVTKKDADGNDAGGVITVEADGKIDVDARISLPGEEAGAATLKNLSAGRTYKIEAKDCSVILEWTKVAVDMDNVIPGGSAKDAIDLGVNFDDLLGDGDIPQEIRDNVLAKGKVEFESVPMYLGVSIPSGIEAFENLAIEGEIYVKYDDGSGAKYLPLSSDGAAGSQSEIPEPTSIKAKDVNVEIERDGVVKPLGAANGADAREGFVATDLAKSGLAKCEFAEAFNARPSSMSICYDLSLSGSSGEVEMTRDDYDALDGGMARVSATVYLVLPMRAKVCDDIDIDLLSVMEKDADDDLLGRDEPVDTDDFDKYLDAVKSAGILVDSSDFFGLEGSEIFLEDSVGKSSFIFGKKSALEFDRDRIRNMLQNCPYFPSIGMSIPAFKDESKSVPTRIELPWDAEMNFGLLVRVVTDGEIEFDTGI